MDEPEKHSEIRDKAAATEEQLLWCDFTSLRILRAKLRETKRIVVSSRSHVKCFTIYF